MSKSLTAQDSPLANVQRQLAILNDSDNGDFSLVPFQQKLEESGLYPLRPTGINIFQVNIVKMCNQLCRRCHVEKYTQKLLDSYNCDASSNVMCRNTISVGWDGFLYYCDFNQMLELKARVSSKHISQFNTAILNNRNIIIGQHCYGCTAGAGSGCGGAVT